MSEKQVVCFTQRVEIVEAYGERRDCADQRISDFLCNCGYIPVPIPNNSAIISDFIERINPCGIILTGGNSLGKYGGNAPERDETDYAIIKYAKINHIPIYGFCRGMQSILDYFGEYLDDVKNHVACRHVVRGSINEVVNSYHNQACVSLKSNSEFNILARTDDGVIESVCHKELPIMANMWHPERENPFSENDKIRIVELFNGGKK